MASVPSKYDLTISDGSNTYGYVLYRPWTGGDSSNASQRAIHSYSPTFVPRQNIQGNYGDDQEEFFMTFSQKDWSLGGFQRHARASNESSTRRFWASDGIHLDNGSIRMGITNASIGSFPTAVAIKNGAGDEIAIASSTNLYTFASSLTNEGAHGLGAAPSSLGLCHDGVNIYLSTTSGGTVGVRKWNGSAFSTFSGTGADSLAFVNNTLYGYRNTAGTLVKYSTAGTATVVHTWQDAAGAASVGDVAAIMPFGGKILILRYAERELWLYDGITPTLIARFSQSFQPSTSSPLAELDGVVYISGYVAEDVTGTKAIVFYYANGQIGTLWQNPDHTNSTLAHITTYGRKLAILSESSAAEKLMFYDPATGSIHIAVIGDLAGNGFYIAGGRNAMVWSRSNAGYSFYTTKSTVSFVQSSLIDFDSSLTKLFRGIKVDYDEDSDGDGGSVDIAYRVNDLGTEYVGSYTTLQTGAVSGTEYQLGSPGSPITGRSISYKITLNKGTSTNGPVLKRVYVRAAPQTPQRHRGLYHIDCSAPDDGSNPVLDNSGQPLPRSGMEMVMELRTLASTGSLVTVTDPLHSFTANLEVLDATQIQNGPDPGYVVTLVAREV